LLLQILTACRPNEAVKATWDEFDLEKKIWTIPSERMKMGKTHRITLSEAALAHLQEIPRLKECALLFPSPSKMQQPLSENALNLVVRRLGYDKDTACAHGFRATFRTWASEQTDFPNDLCEIALAHVNKDKVEAAYQRSDMLEKRFALLNAWGEYCAS